MGHAVLLIVLVQQPKHRVDRTLAPLLWLQKLQLPGNYRELEQRVRKLRSRKSRRPVVQQAGLASLLKSFSGLQSLKQARQHVLECISPDELGCDLKSAASISDIVRGGRKLQLSGCFRHADQVFEELIFLPVFFVESRHLTGPAFLDHFRHPSGQAW